MIKMLKYKLLVALLLTILTSCNSSKTTYKHTKNNILYANTWIQTLNSKKELFMEIFKLEVLKGNSSWNKMRPELNMSASELKNLDCIPVESYEIEKGSLSTISSEVDLINAMTLKKDEANCFLVKNNDFLTNGLFELKNGIWSSIEYGLIDKAFSASLADLYFRRKAKLILVHLKISNDFRLDYYVYSENKSLWLVNNPMNEQKKTLFVGLQEFKKTNF